MRLRLAAALFAFALTACRADTTAPASTNDAAVLDTLEDWVPGGDRPVGVFRVPAGYDPKKPAPLVMVLHGFGAGAIVQNVYFRLPKIADEKGFFIVAPEGTVDKSGKRFWNAVDTCCDFDKTGVDDVKFLTGLVDEIAAHYSIDKKRVYLVGHSNGGAMSLRLACDASDRFAAIAVLAPPFYSDPASCKPKGPVAVRLLHGTADDTVPYDPGLVSVGKSKHPGALATVKRFVETNGCNATADESAPPIDLDGGPAGAETKISKWTGCKENADVELWTMTGSTHIPTKIGDDFGTRIWDFLSAHPKQ